MKTIREILNDRSTEIHAVKPGQSVLSVAQFMRSKNIGAVSVMLESKLLGIISERDMLNKVVSLGVDPRDIFANEIMTCEPAKISPDDTWEDALNKMRNSHCRHLPVVERGKLMGMISLRDLLGQEEADLLDNYLWDRYERQDKFMRPELDRCF